MRRHVPSLLVVSVVSLIFIQFAKGQWNTCSNGKCLLRDDDEMAVGVWEGVVYLIAGYYNPRQVAAYTIATQTWNDIGKNVLSHDVAGRGQYYTQQGTVVYVINRMTGNTFSTYNLLSNQFTEDWGSSTYGTFDRDVSYRGCLASTSQYLYVVGGGNTDGTTYLKNVQMLNIATKQWMSSPPDMKTARGSGACIVHNDYLWAIAGYKTNTWIKSVERIIETDIASNTWSYTDDLSVGLSTSRVAAQYDTLYVIGGFDGNAPTDYMHLIDADTGVVSLSSHSLPSTIAWGSPVIWDSVLYNFGGDSVDNSRWHYYPLPGSNSPSKAPSKSPTKQPSISPSSHPTGSPTQFPTSNPTASPTQFPTSNPTTTPTDSPMQFPTSNPTGSPTQNPTQNPSFDPSSQPSFDPSFQPSSDPSSQPSSDPSQRPSLLPTNIPIASEPTIRLNANGAPVSPHSDATNSPTTVAIAIDATGDARENSKPVKPGMDLLLTVLVVVCGSLCLIVVVVVGIISGVLKKEKKSLKQVRKILDIPNIPYPFGVEKRVDDENDIMGNKEDSIEKLYINNQVLETGTTTTGNKEDSIEKLYSNNQALQTDTTTTGNGEDTTEKLYIKNVVKKDTRSAGNDDKNQVEMAATVEGDQNEVVMEVTVEGQGVRRDEATDAAMNNDQDASCEQCIDCGKPGFGKIDDEDGLFYCNQCWKRYDHKEQTT